MKIMREGGFERITFAEEPDQSVLEALRAAGFHPWVAGSWVGKADRVPQIVKDLIQREADDHYYA